MSTALIVGITGQDGSFLAQHLLSSGYEVHGTVRVGNRDPHISRPLGYLAAEEYDRLTLHDADLADYNSLLRVLRAVRPREVYNLGGQSRVGASFMQPLLTGDVTGFGVVRLLDAIREVDPEIKFFQAGSSEMFGATPPPQHEYSSFHPRSPYAVAKIYAYFATMNYREAYDLFACTGILFNHDSPRRPPEFVTRKITHAVPRLLSGELDKLTLGNLDIARDWGHARDYVRAMHLMLQQETPRDLVIGTGRSITLRQFLDHALSRVGLDWEERVVSSPDLLRPSDVAHVRCDPTRAWGVLDWRAETTVEQLIDEMVEYDLALHAAEARG